MEQMGHRPEEPGQLPVQDLGLVWVYVTRMAHSAPQPWACGLPVPIREMGLQECVCECILRGWGGGSLGEGLSSRGHLLPLSGLAFLFLDPPC